MGITSIVRPAFCMRQRAIEAHLTGAKAMQEQVLKRLLSRAERTEYGLRHGFQSLLGYDDFQKKTPLNTYETLKNDIDRMRHGESDVLWRGKVIWFAKSSGTTADKSKFIPVSHDGLHHIHYLGGKDAVAAYLLNNPKSRMFDGKGLILGGSHSPNYNVASSLVGDLSSILIENINPLVNIVRTPKKSTALLADFERKRELIAKECLQKRVTNISGVPSWMLSVLSRVMEISGKSTLWDVWPEMEVFFHGGVAFTPYRKQYEALLPTGGGREMHYEETYNASEGFFGVQTDPKDASMLLMSDYDVFYEFIPMTSFGKENPEIVPLWGVEEGVNYAMVISTSCGLWRYVIGDTVMFTGTNPYKFRITGRTKHFINAFGEEVIVDNAEKALQAACQKTGAEILEYTAAPVFMDKDGHCAHEWLIEFQRKPDDMGLFTRTLDARLKEINSDYEAKRNKDITLQMPVVRVARKGLFNDWLKKHGKLGGQHKVPRLSNERKTLDELLSLMKPNPTE